MVPSAAQSTHVRFAAAAALYVLTAAAALGAGAPPVVLRSVRNRTSAPLRAYRPSGPARTRSPREVENGAPAKRPSAPASGDPVVQRRAGTTLLAPVLQFEGGADSDNDALIGGRIVPSDTNGDVGPNHYVQYINLFFTIYDKAGNVVLGPVAGNAFWAGLGTACETSNDGDTIVQYDQLADRWMVSQFALPNFPFGPFHQCVAVSTTGDPTGAYYQYDFVYSDEFLNDYPHFGVWPDAYTMTANEFQAPGLSFAGTGIVAFDRAAMLAGLPATGVKFEIPDQFGVLPADLDGLTPPPGGAPQYLLTFDTDPSRLIEWRLHADFAAPANSTLSDPIDIPTSDFVAPVCGAPREQCIPQLDSDELLEALGGRVMYRLGYRNFGDHESLLTNFTINGASSGSQAAIRWSEVRDPGGAPAVFQEGTYAPDASHRFMGSIAMDAVGNVALGYSKSDAASYPSLAVAGRLEGDPAGTLGAEDVFLAGTGSQTQSGNRWGDYSAMTLDPTDDCTFWFTGEYYQTTGRYDWHTRVAAFRFESCTRGPVGTLEGTVTDGKSPLAGAVVTAGELSTTTDASGHYAFRLPVGTYDMTASHFGFAPGAASGVAVTDGGDTVQDFALAATPVLLVNGVVRDGTGGGWPLYARIDVTAPGGFAGVTVFTDPVTGYYALNLSSGATYAFAIHPVSDGYTALDASVPVAAAAPGASPVVQNFSVSADLQACSAPGYTGQSTQDFSSGLLPPSWSERVSFSPWQFLSGPDACQTFDGNLTGGTGGFAAVTTTCEHGASNSELKTPTINLAAAASAQIQWHNDYHDFSSIADVDVSIDGGVSWTNVWERAGVDEIGPGLQTVDISALAAGQPRVQARFHYLADFALWWQIDDVSLGVPGVSCHPVPGGLVVGTVRDANTGLPLIGATVTNLPQDAVATTFATPDDPNQDDGFFILFGGNGSQPFEAAEKNYTSQDLSTLVVPQAAVRLDFSLPAGRLAATPRPVEASVPPGGSTQLTLSLANTGGRDAHFTLGEIDVPPVAAPAGNGPFASPEKRLEALRRLVPNRNAPRPFGAFTAKGFPPPPDGPQKVPTLPAGRVIASYPTNLAFGWGLVYDTDANDYWVSNINAGGGDDKDYRYLADGTPTGDTIDDRPAIEIFAADGAYDPRTKTFWRVDVTDVASSCIFELDPAAKALTGNRICPDTGVSERGLAYDTVTDTWYFGSWNDLTITHFDSTGRILDSAYVGINIAGLTYNPTTRHLFALVNIPDHGHDVFVYDVANGYALVGAFPITDASGAFVLTGGGGLDADCDGNLWVVDLSAQLAYKVVSGEGGFCPVDIPWLTVDPLAGTVAAAAGAGAGQNPFPITLTFDAGATFPGLHQGQLQILSDTPYEVPALPVNLTVRFADVAVDVPPGADPFEAFIYGAAGAQVMPGCDRNGSLFCPNETTSGAAGLVTRADMAAYVWRAVHGAFAPPPVYAGVFTDVNPFDRNADYIQGIFDEGITAGCQASPRMFCPRQPISRAQMAVFIEKGVRGSDFVPPPCTGVFGDVPCPATPAAPFADWVELLYADGISAGCSAGGPPEFCPARRVPNEQMAVFLVKAFHLPHL